jgi:ParB family transcriptional regulator, chromosome partitioning protein
MNEPLCNRSEPIDRHRIDTPFASTRVHHDQALRRLIASLEASGQQVPLVVVASGERLVLVDGYRRWEALGRLGRDTMQCVVWNCALAEALGQVLARHQARPFEPIEQAWLLSAMQAEGMSQRALAECVGKDPSWVNRRLALLSALSEPLQEAVREGAVSTWAANRVFVPLARANSADAERLLGQVRDEPLSTRQLATWLEHYRQGNRTVRERLLTHPRLFIQSLAAESGAEDPPPDPEGQWLQELQRVGRKLGYLRRALSELLSPSPPAQTWQSLRQAVAKTAQALERIRQPLQEGPDAHRAPTSDHPRAAPKGDGHPPDQPHPGPLPPHGAQGTERGQPPAATTRDERTARTHLAAARALLQGPGECGADPGDAA